MIPLRRGTQKGSCACRTASTTPSNLRGICILLLPLHPAMRAKVQNTTENGAEALRTRGKAYTYGKAHGRLDTLASLPCSTKWASSTATAFPCTGTLKSWSNNLFFGLQARRFSSCFHRNTVPTDVCVAYRDQPVSSWRIFSTALNL